MSSQPILVMRDIVKEFNGVKALNGVDIEVERGEIHALCGENGAGKSTLMKILSGVYETGSFEGNVTFEGNPVAYRSITDSERDGIVIIHQELALSPYLSIAENIFLGNENAKYGVIDWNLTNRKAVELLQKVGLKENPATIVNELGVGKQQLVEIAKALSKDVKLLILDEPTAALNDNDSENLLQLINSLRGQGITSIIISHKLKEIQKISDRITVIRDGKSIETMVVSDPETTEARIIKSMVGRELSSLFPERTPQLGDEALRVESWNVYDPSDLDRKRIEDAEFSVRNGEIIGFAGLMGAGRTELAMSIFGRSYGTKISGRVFKAQREIFPSTIPQAIENGIAYVTEDRKKYGLNLIQSISKNISAVGLGKLSRFGVIDQNTEIKVAEDYRQRMNIRTSSVQQIVGSLSGGNQQKVVLSKWMYNDPDVLFLDEPTRGIDVGAKFEIYQIINALAAAGKAIVVISSELPELFGICDRIYALSEGRITGQVDAKTTTQEQLMTLMTASRSA